jgi:hypothetical protein
MKNSKSKLFFVAAFILISLAAIVYGTTRKPASLSVFSCDPVVNQWAVENIASIRTLSRAQAITLEPGRLRAAIIAFTPEQKMHFWKGKVDNALKLAGWDKEEVKHLDDLENAIDIKWFEPGFANDAEASQKFNDFKKNWIKTAIVQFHWSEKLIDNLLISGYDLKNKSGDINMATVYFGSKLKKAATEGCNCTSSNGGSEEQNGCPLRHGSTIPLHCTLSNQCQLTGTGCGIMGLTACNGSCALQ